MALYGNVPIVGNKLYDDLDLNGHKITGTGEIEVSGALIGGIKPVSKSAGATLTTSEVYGHFVTHSGASPATFVLPAVVVGMFVSIYAETAQAITVDPNASDRIILDGTALADGVAIVSSGDAGDVVTLYGDSTDGWTVISRGGAWASE